MNKIVEEDVSVFAKDFALSGQLTKSTFLVTGATGLIGSSLIRCLLALDEQIKIYAPVRNLKKAEALFDEWQKEKTQNTIQGILMIPLSPWTVSPRWQCYVVGGGCSSIQESYGERETKTYCEMRRHGWWDLESVVETQLLLHEQNLSIS